MAEIRMPSLGSDMESGTLLEWKVRVGDHVTRGAIVGLVETQKATMELESFADGVIEALLVEPGTKVPVGTVLARLADGDAAPATPPPVVPATAPVVPATAPVVPATAPVVVPVSAPVVAPSVLTATAPVVVPVSAPVAAPSPPVPAAPGRVRSSPAARKRAREVGVDLAVVHGTGPHGAIILRDVPAAPSPPSAIPAAPSPPSAVPAAPSPPPAVPVAPRRPSAGTPMREAVGAAMSRSKREIPHYYLAHTISMHRALAWLAERNAPRTIQDRILPAALLLRAVTVALWEVPELNGFWIDGAYQPSEPVHLGTAIALRTGGLIAPAILDAEDKTLDQVMAELHDLVGRARAGRLRGSELTSATITVTSLGDRGCETVFPVIVPPQVAIVGFGAILDRPWALAGAVVVHPTVVATLAADHRVSDGHRGGLFLAAIDRALQEPATL